MALGYTLGLQYIYIYIFVFIFNLNEIWCTPQCFLRHLVPNMRVYFLKPCHVV